MADRYQTGFDDEGLPVYSDEDREAWLYNPKTAAMKAFSDMQVGDIIAYFDRPRCEILRLAEPRTDILGRKMKAHWARALDGSGREGYVTYGEGGQAPVERT